MNYGDGMYGGQFIGSMYSAAYFENDMEKIIENGLESIPSVRYYAVVSGMLSNGIMKILLTGHKTWNKIEEKYQRSRDYQKFAAERKSVYVPIDSKINGAYVVMGLLYGKGDMDSTIVIAMRGGKDSDCNPSNAGGVLATTIGYKNLPEKFKAALDKEKKFSYSEYNFNDLIQIVEDFARQFIVRNGGKIETDEKGEEYFLITGQRMLNHQHYIPSYDPGALQCR